VPTAEGTVTWIRWEKMTRTRGMSRWHLIREDGVLACNAKVPQGREVLKVEQVGDRDNKCATCDAGGAR